MIETITSDDQIVAIIHHTVCTEENQGLLPTLFYTMPAAPTEAYYQL